MIAATFLVRKGRAGELREGEGSGDMILCGNGGTRVWAPSQNPGTVSFEAIRLRVLPGSCASCTSCVSSTHTFGSEAQVLSWWKAGNNQGLAFQRYWSFFLCAKARNEIGPKCKVGPESLALNARAPLPPNH